MKIIMLLTLILVPCALAQMYPAGDHTYVMGTPGINETVINWTDNKDYSDIQKRVHEYTVSEDSKSSNETQFELSLFKSGNDLSSILYYKIYWHPEIVRPSSVKPNEYPSEIIPIEIDLNSDIIIQNKTGILVRYKEKTIRFGPNIPPTTLDPYFYACYFPNDYTEVVVQAETANWTESELRSMLESLEVVTPQGHQ